MSARKPKPAPKIQKNQNLQVFVRCRPLSASEVNQRGISAVDINGQKEIVVQDRCNSKITKTFSFDKVFGPSTPQSEVYQNVVEPLISDVLAGFNCTVFAYGQTGSGKTFTMEGDFGTPKRLSPESNAGLIPRAMCALFDELRVLQAEYTVRISLMELYNEELYDLLSSDEVPPKLRLFDDASRKGSVLVQGLQEVMVHTQSQVLDELHKGSAKRQVAATLMNAQSSRSHTIFTVTVHFKENSADGGEFLRTGKLNLVDLAGSENIGRSGSSDKRAREAASINQSLLTLSRVTSCLVEHQPHVPYRESKLTRLLQDSLGGRTKTSLIATISPSHLNAEETISTLDYAHRAKSVSNKPEVNQKVSQNVIMKEYTDVIESLKKKLERHRNGSGVYVNDENYKQVMEQTQARNQTICQIIAQARAVAQKKKDAEEIFLVLFKDKDNKQKNLEQVNQLILQTGEEIKAAHMDRLDAQTEQNSAGKVLEDVTNKEKEIREQAEQYVKVIDSAHNDTQKIHNKLDFSRVVISENAVVVKKCKERAEFYRTSVAKLSNVFVESEELLLKLSDAVDTLNSNAKMRLNLLFQEIREQLKKTASTSSNVQELLAKHRAHNQTMADGSRSSLVTFHLEEIKILKSIEQLLSDAVTDFNKFMVLLPCQSSSLLDFARESVEKLKLDIQKQTDEIESQHNIALSVSEINIETIKKHLDELLLKEEMLKLCHHQQVTREKRSAIAQHISAAKEEINKHRLDIQNSHERKESKVCEIKQKMCDSADYLTQQQNKILSPVRELKNALEPFAVSLEAGISNRFNTMSNTVYDLCTVGSKCKDDVSSLLDSDRHPSITQIISECKDMSSESAAQLQSARDSVNTVAEETIEASKTFTSNHEGINQVKSVIEEKEDELLGMFIDGMKSANIEIQERFEMGKTEIVSILSSEIQQDTPTGQTPSRRSYGPIPAPTFLPSPIKRTAKSKIERAPWKKLLRSPRKPLVSSNSLREFDDDINDGMASDSELSLPHRALGLNKLQKASSLCDLRSNSKSGTVFHRPRIPKKVVRNGPL